MKILIFIVIIIISIVRAVNQNKQKAQKKTVSTSTPPLKEIWETILEEKKAAKEENDELDDVFSFDDEEIVEEEAIPEPIKVADRFKYDFKPQEEGQSDVVEEKYDPIKNPGKKKNKILGSDFSLKKAIIYSEIINRKYV